MTVADKMRLKILAGTTLAGGALMALLTSLRKKDEDKDETDSHSIYVPLSYRDITRPVRESKEKRSKGESKKEAPKLLPSPASVDTALDMAGVNSVEDLSDKDIASLKRQLLKGASDCASKTDNQECDTTKAESKENNLKQEAEASSCNEVKHVNAPVFEEAVIGHKGEQPRDEKGRFTEAPLKEAEFTPFDDAARVVGYMGLGALGLTGGAYLTKKLIDKIQLNREQERVERARRRYVDAMAQEMNDVDTPYYNALSEKTAGANEDVGLIGQGLGFYVGAGILSAAAAGTIAYKILSNRIEQENRDIYKQLGAKTPNVMFKVVKDKKDADPYK